MKRITRRNAIAGLSSATAIPLAAQTAEPPDRITPRTELVNLLEFEEVARRKLTAAVFTPIAGGDRAYFDRITFRPRMMVPTTGMDLTVALPGGNMFAPILIGPTATQKNYHPDGELAMVRGASAAKAWMVVSSDSGYAIDKITAESRTTLWFQAWQEPGERTRIEQAVKSGCKAVCVAVRPTTPGINWKIIDGLRKNLDVPFLIKGIMTQAETAAALQYGVNGIVVSSYGKPQSSLEALPAITDTVSGKIPILIDGSFRRGSDVVKALALGATAVMLGRPPLWALAAYGAEGVQTMMEMIQTETARCMVQCGRLNLKALDRSVVKIHAV